EGGGPAGDARLATEERDRHALVVHWAVDQHGENLLLAQDAQEAQRAGLERDDADPDLSPRRLNEIVPLWGLQRLGDDVDGEAPAGQDRHSHVGVADVAAD